MSDRILSIGVTIIALFWIVSIVQATQDFSGLPPGPYCAKYNFGRCCPGRKDDCSAPILGTTCYCDDFCNRTREDDCCPDYWSHCKGITLNSEEPDFPTGAFLRNWKTSSLCSFEGRNYNHGETFKQNCNVCKCSSIGLRAEVLCEENRCLVEEDLLEELNLQSENLNWRAANQTKFWGRSLSDGFELRLGTLNPSKSVYRMNPVKRIYDPDALPKEFDARSRWPRDISGVRDQGWCGASWAVSTVDVASDRFALMSKGSEDIDLSAQHLISCNNRGQQGCRGGYLDRAWLFVRKFGLVDEDCYPWLGKNDKCKLRRKSNLRSAGCQNPINPMRTELYKVGPAYRLGNETDIMQEIITSGPVQATMRVHQDFFLYESGIYTLSKSTRKDRSGYHSVRILGWGEEFFGNQPPVKFWIVANSWGTDWGENGLFRIQKGTNECEIESYVLGAWAKIV